MPRRNHRCTGCREYRALSRRGFLSRAPAAAAAMAAPAWLPRIALGQDASSRDTLVVIMLRGGMDGLTAVVPYGDPNLYGATLRPNLAIQPPGSLAGAVDLDGFFGLAPAMAPLLPAYQSGQLLIVHATGSPDPTRSHFDAFNFMEYGIPSQPLTISTGWLARHLLTIPPLSDGPLRAVAVTPIIPKMLTGAPGTLPIPDPARLTFPGRITSASLRRAVLEGQYVTAHALVASTALGTIATIDLLDTIDFENYQPAGGAVYPDTEFGRALRSIAALLKADVGVEAATTELMGWDTHHAQGVLEGEMAALMNELSTGLAAFHLDVQSVLHRVTLVAMSEFGRRVDENSSAGSDHGHGGALFVMGGHIDGGRVLADWTDGELLHPDLLYEGDALDVTIDYRDIVGEIVQHRLLNSKLSAVFPNYTPVFRGITL